LLDRRLDDLDELILVDAPGAVLLGSLDLLRADVRADDEDRVFLAAELVTFAPSSSAIRDAWSRLQRSNPPVKHKTSPASG
jgi:hypothetical protein